MPGTWHQRRYSPTTGSWTTTGPTTSSATTPGRRRCTSTPSGPAATCSYSPTGITSSGWMTLDIMLGHFREGYYVYNDRIESHELAGFIKKGGNLRLVLVRNAGHSVPTNQPLWALRNRVTTWGIKNISLYLQTRTTTSLALRLVHLMLTLGWKVAFKFLKHCHFMLMKRYCLTFLQTETAFYSWGLRTLINGICTEVKLYILGSWKTLLMREFNISYVQVNQAW